MKKIKLLALADLHLGEPESVLFNSGDEFNLIDITISKIMELSKRGKDFDRGVEQLILIGDIVDLSEATDEEAYANTKFFLTSLLDKVEVDKIIYVPGNHDHHLWVELLKKERGKNDYRDCTPKIQINSSISKKSLFIEHCLPNNYPSEKVEIRYPSYRFETKNAYYFFDHGHLFSNHRNAPFPNQSRSNILSGSLFGGQVTDNHFYFGVGKYKGRTPRAQGWLQEVFWAGWLYTVLCEKG